MCIIVKIPYTYDGINIFYETCYSIKQSDKFICNVLDKGGDILSDRTIKLLGCN